MLSEAADCANRPPLLTRQPMEAVIMAQDSLPAIAGAIKCCKACGENKPHSDFYIDKRDGRPMGRCKPCWIKKTGEYAKANPDKMREWSLKSRRKHSGRVRARTWKYRQDNPEKVRENSRKQNRKRKLAQMGVTESYLSARLAAQGGKCAICQVEEVHLDGGRYVHLDHCHRTMKFRGLLCLKCNTGLGKFGDDADRLARAAAYLRGEDEKSVQFRGEIIRV